jgi:hypothetical protein
VTHGGLFCGWGLLTLFDPSYGPRIEVSPHGGSLKNNATAVDANERYAITLQGTVKRVPRFVGEHLHYLMGS